jgi:secreted trypsin-like serine protease
MLDRDKASVLPPEALCATKQPLSWAPVLLNAPVLAPLQPAPCAGDDGGPLLATEPDGKPVQVGIVSFAVTTANAACGSSETPAAYTNVSAYESWVRSVINGR